MATGMCAASSSVFPLDLPVHLLLPSGTQAHSVWLTAQDAEATTVLSLAQRFLPDASPLQDACIVTLSSSEGEVQHPVTDVQAPVAAVLTALPADAVVLRVVFRHKDCLHAAPGGSAAAGPAAPIGKRRRAWLPWLARRLRRLVVLGVRLVVTVEVLGFVVSRIRLVRHLGRRARWGPDTTDLLSSSEEGEDSMGTSSEVAEALLAYLDGDATKPSNLRGLTAELLARGIKKIQPEDLQELGLDDTAGVMKQLELLAQAVKDAEQPGASGGGPRRRR